VTNATASGSEEVGARLAPPRTLWALLAADLVGAMGVGLTQPYTVVFLHLGKGIAIPIATALLCLLAVASLIGNPVSGVLIDRIGGRPVMAGGYAVSALGLIVVAAAPGPVGSAAGIALVGLGASVSIPALSALIGEATPEPLRPRIYTMEYALFNVGLGLGTAAGALGISHGRAGMLIQWSLAAGVYALAGGAVALGWLRGRQPRLQVAPAPRSAGGYRAVLADRRLLWVLLMALIVMVAGYGLYGAGLPALSLLGSDPRALTWAGVANCVVVVAGLPLSLAVPGRLGHRGALAAAAGLWSVAWLLCALAAGGHGPLSVRAAVVTGAALTGGCELLVAGALPSMVNDIAAAELRGRYNATLTLTNTGGNLIAPLLVAAATAIGSLLSAFAVAVSLFVVLAFMVSRSYRPQQTEVAA
jgi:MFS family permease